MAEYDNDPGFADWLNKRGEGHLLNSVGAAPAAPKPEEDPGFADWLNKRGEGHLLQPTAPPPAAPVAQNGLPYEIGRQLVAGAAVDAPKMLAKAGEWFSPAGSGAEEMFREGKKSWGADEKGWEPQTEGRGALGKMLVGGARSAAPSIGAMAGSVAAAAAFQPEVAIPLAAAGISGLFGGSQAQDTYDKAREEGRGHDESRSIGWKTGAIEGLGETVGDVLGGKFLQGAYKGVGLLAGTAGKEGLGAALKQATSPKWAGTFAKDWAGNAAVQSGTEYGQNYGEAAVERAHGLRAQDPHEAGMEGAGAALGLSMLLGPFMGYGHARAGTQRAELGRVLADPSTPLETKLALGKQLHDNVVLPQVGEEQAASWLQAFNESAVQDFGGRDERAGLPNGELPLTQNRPTNLLATEPPAMPTEQMEMFGAPPAQGELFGEPPAGPVAPPGAMSEGLTDTGALDAAQTLSLDEQITAHDKGIEAATKSLARAKTDKTRATWQAKLDALTAKRAAAVQAKAAVGERTLRNATSTSVLAPATDTSQQGALPFAERQGELFGGATEGAREQAAPAAEATGNVAPVEPTTTASIYNEDTADEAPALTPEQELEQELELDADLGGAIDAYNATELAAPAKGAKGAKAASTSKAKGASPLNVDVKDDTVRVLEGKVGREDQGWLATVARALAGGTWADKNKKGNAGPKFAKPRYYVAGTNTTDSQLEATHGAKVDAVLTALHKLTRAAADLYNKKSNLLPATKAKGEVGTEATEAARHRDEYDKAHAATRAAVEELKAAAGSEKAGEAVIAAYKMRVQKVGQKDTPKANYHVAVDALASRAWADYKHGALAEGKADTIRERPIRRSWELEARKLEDSPLKAAATEGHTRRVATKSNTVNNPPETGLLGVVNYLQMHGGAFEAMLAASVGRALRQAKTQPAIKWLDDPTSKAYYDPATDTIALHENASPVEALHEALHAALQWYVYSNPNNAHVLGLRAALNRLLTPEVLKQAKAHGKAGEVLDVLAKLNKGKDGWKNAVLELISYGGTLNSFREFMKTLDMLSPEERKAADPSYSPTAYGKMLESMRAVWRKLTALVQSFLGTTETLANDVLESSMALLSDVEAALDTAAGGTSTARPGATKGKQLDGKLNADVTDGDTVRKVRTGSNTARLAKLLGQQLYGNMDEMATITTKELFQNSFDALKTLVESEGKADGKITINTDESARTIIIEDNGSGMTPEVITKAFLTLAGTSKETGRSSGGFGIAKMQFLFGNKHLRLETVRNGVETVLDTSGQELMDSMDVAEGEIGGVDMVSRPTDKPSGTKITVTVPETYTNPSTGNTDTIQFPSNWGSPPTALKNSPLLENIEVEYNGDILQTGKHFPAKAYTHFADVKFAWGNARIIVSKNESSRYGRNTYVLSNGLYQFDLSLKVDPNDPYGDNIKRTIYVNVEPAVAPEEQGYPFELSRQGFSAAARDDFANIFKYISMLYRGNQLAETSQGFGTVEFLELDGSSSGKQTLAPSLDKAADQTARINEGDAIEVKDGRLIVNGREVPVLTKEDIEKASIDLSKFKMDQDTLPIGKVALHNNLQVKNMSGDMVPITDAAREVFGQRFGEFTQSLGEVFIDLRDSIQNVGGSNYSNIGDMAVGISFDREYHGVHVRIPFHGMFLNPSTLQYDDVKRQTISLFSTMVHEAAHFAEMSHDASFWAEDNNLRLELEANNLTTPYKNRIKAVLEAYEDVLTYLRVKQNESTTKNIGAQLSESGYQRVDAAVAGNNRAQQRNEAGDGSRAGDNAGLGQAGRAEVRSSTGQQGARAAGSVADRADVSAEGEGRAPLASEFGAGFGASKVVDGQGRLIPMYHGGADVAGMGGKAIFKVTGRGALGIGGYFTPDKPFAEEYAKEKGGVVTETYLRVTNPLVLNSTSASDPMVDALVMLGKTRQQAENTVEKAYEEHGYVGAQVKSLAQKQGYDGIMQYREGKLREVVVWNNNQIKHSSNTAPTYGPNILYADVTPDPVDQATEDVLQKHAATTRKVDHTKYAPTRGPLQRMFESWGYTKDTAHDFTMSAINKALRLIGVTDSAKWAARIVDFRTHLQEWAPRTAQALSMLDAGFNITETMRATILDAKHMRGVPISVVNNFTRYLEKMPSEQAIAAFAYLDAAAKVGATKEELTTLAKSLPANVKEAADHLAGVYKEQITKLETEVGAEKEAAYLRSIPLSEALLYVVTDDNLSTGNVTGRSFGAHSVNRLLGAEMGRALSDNVRTLTAWDGLKTLDGKFYRFTMTKNPGSTEVGKYGFVHSGAFGKLTPEERASVDREQSYRMGVVKPEKGGDPTVAHVPFTGTKSLNKMLREGKAEDVSAAMLNTMNLLANATAASETARQILSAGEGGTDKNGKPVRQTVFDNEAAFRAFKDDGGRTPYADKRLQQVGNAEERSGTIAYLYRHPDAWVQVPDSAAYGVLKGHIIRGPEWSALSDAYNRSQFIDSSFYNSTLRGFKKVKTVYSLPTHVTNVLTNVTLLYMHNIQAATLKDAGKLYKDFLLSPEKMSPEQHALMKEFIDSGAVLADYSANEMKEVLFKAIEHKVTGGGGLWATVKSMLGTHAELVENIAKKGAKVDETMTTLYATGDNVFRLAAFLSEMGRLEQDTESSLTHAEQVKAAGRFAATAFLDYDIDARAVQIARQTFLPFVSWTYAITPVLSRIAVEQPWKLVGLGTTFSVLGALASAAAGGDDDDEARKRERMDEKVFLGQFGPYANMRVPFLDSNGKKAYINLGKYIPNPYSFKDMPNGIFGIKNYPSSLAPSGPLMAFAAAVFGVDPYTGKRMTKDINTNLENALTMGKQFALQMAPPAATVLAKAGDNGLTGKPKDPLNTFTSLTGVPPVRRVDTDEARKNEQLSIKKINKDFEAERTRLAGERKRGNLSIDDYLERVKVLRERKFEGIREYRGG